MSAIRRSTKTHLSAVLLVSVLVVSVLVLAACSESDPGRDSAAPVEIAIDTFQFGPDPLTVAVGTTVRFENRDGTLHTVTAGTRENPQPEIIDEQLGQGDMVEWTFDEPGTYDYFCALHSGPGMTGQVIVT